MVVSADGGWKYLSTGAWTDDLDEVTERAKEIIYFYASDLDRRTAAQQRPEGAELGHRVPVPGGADDAEAPLQERPGVLGLRVAVRRVHVDLLAVDDELVASARGKGERIERRLRRARGEEGHVVARRVGARLGVGARRADTQEVGDAADEDGGCVTEVLGQALLYGGGDAGLALGSGGEEDVPRLDVRRDIAVAEGVEGRPEFVHGEAAVARDVDTAEQGDVAGHPAQPTGPRRPVRTEAWPCGAG